MLVVCPQLLEEVQRALLHPRVGGKYGFEVHEIDAFVERLQQEGVAFEDPADPPRVVPGDRNDDYLVALALTSGADFFVTRDHHFDNVRAKRLRIRTPGRLVRELRRAL